MLSLDVQMGDICSSSGVQVESIHCPPFLCTGPPASLLHCPTFPEGLGSAPLTATPPLPVLFPSRGPGCPAFHLGAWEAWVRQLFEGVS